MFQISQQKRKNAFSKKKLKEPVGKPIDLWKSFKSFGLPNKSGGCTISVPEENQIVKHDTKCTLCTLKIFYSNLAETLLAKLPKPPN